ncbi:hypothetical protein [Neobacillus sp. MM2021_6]|uniref:hypothetical protein n=1 Tax=Neobacillus sp. MM2021_6 TaxID=2817026 RepID=UPI001A94E70F|nr:hypothetical protein [Neobacillus sp. MM2021_6]NHC21444.1 hypothetical protein [Bacillus sp. MM2020_4]
MENWKGVIQVLSFEEKRAIFHSFKLKEKKISNGRVSFVYPESHQKGQVLATQLHPSGNGYVNGKYMSAEIIEKYGYEVDPRGWISIKVFSKDEIAKVITEAMRSMAVVPSEEPFEKNEKEISQQTDEPVEEQGITGRKVEKSLETQRMETIEKIQPSTYEIYPGSCLFTWLGLTLSTMEYGFLVWRKAVRKYAGIGSK